MKICKACGKPFPPEAFFPHRTTKDRLSQACRVCTAAQAKAYRAANAEKLRAASAAYREENRESHNAKSRAWAAKTREKYRAAQKAYRDANPEKHRQRHKDWRAENPEYFHAYERARAADAYVRNLLYRFRDPAAWRARSAEYSRIRKAHEGKACPPWADRRKIRDIYLLCQIMTEATGVPHEVDHIIPLRGKNICGLHIETNLQILPASVNRAKGNRYETD